jgi:hypothetical protein
LIDGLDENRTPKRNQKFAIMAGVLGIAIRSINKSILKPMIFGNSVDTGDCHRGFAIFRACVTLSHMMVSSPEVEFVTNLIRSNLTLIDPTNRS